MSTIKEIMTEHEIKICNKLDGYRKKLYAEGTYNMPCPYCSTVLSDSDIKKTQCIHCGHVFNW